MAFLATLLVYKFYEKQKLVKSLKASLWILLGGLIATLILNYLGLREVPYIHLAVYFGLVYILASGQIEFLKGYRTQKPLTTAIVATVIAFIVNLLILLGLLAYIGITLIDDVIILALAGGAL